MTLKWLIKSEAYLRLCQASMNRAFKNSRRRCSVRKTVLRNFAKFTGKQAEVCNFIKKETLAQLFSCEFCESSRNIFFTKHLCATASELFVKIQNG